MKIRKNDKVKIISGKYKGVKSEVQVAIPKEGKIIVKDVNVVTKHLKQDGGKGGRVKIPKSFDVSKVMLICPKCEKSARVGYKKNGGKKVRFCKKCNEII